MTVPTDIFTVAVEIPEPGWELSGTDTDEGLSDTKATVIVVPVPPMPSEYVDPPVTLILSEAE